MGVVLSGWQLHNMSLRRTAGADMRLLAEEALKDGACRTVGHKMAFFTAEQAVQWAEMYIVDGGEGGGS